MRRLLRLPTSELIDVLAGVLIGVVLEIRLDWIA